GWQALQAEADVSGFRVLWRKNDGTYSEWTVDATGQYVSGKVVSNVVDVEVFYNVDLNGDNTIGHVTTAIESNGATTLGSSTRGAYVIDGTIDLTRNGADAGPNSYPGWQALQAEADVSGFRVLWRKNDGTYSEWTVDATGQYVSGKVVSNVANVEAFYGADIDGSGSIGNALPRLAAPTSPEPRLVSIDNAIDVSDWDESSDHLKFIPELSIDEDVEDAYTLVEMLNARGPGLPGFEGQDELTWFSLPKIEDKEDFDLALAALWEEDSFLL
uniref:hypothetical protein n=1 Tax=Ruegeria sp. HKCCA6837 TaxID=2682989 RepID=UPI001C2BDE42